MRLFTAGPRSGFAMGCDGGTIPKRHELVKGPKKVEKVSGEGPGGHRGCWGLQGARGGGGGVESVGFQIQLRPFFPLGELRI